MQCQIAARIHSSEAQPMRFRTFRESIRNMGGVRAGNDVYFAQTQSQYTAAFCRSIRRNLRGTVQSAVAGLMEAGTTAACMPKN